MGLWIAACKLCDNEGASWDVGPWWEWPLAWWPLSWPPPPSFSPMSKPASVPSNDRSLLQKLSPEWPGYASEINDYGLVKQHRVIKDRLSTGWITFTNRIAKIEIYIYKWDLNIFFKCNQQKYLKRVISHLSTIFGYEFWETCAKHEFTTSSNHKLCNVQGDAEDFKIDFLFTWKRYKD